MFQGSRYDGKINYPSGFLSKNAQDDFLVGQIDLTVVLPSKEVIKMTVDKK